jgi:hypothetical protein
MSLEAIFQEVKTLPEEDRLRLIDLIITTLSTSDEKRFDVSQFRGIGKYAADGEDPQHYVRHLRDEWDASE